MVAATRDPTLAALLREVRRIEAESARLVMSLQAGAWASRFRGAGIEFDEVREYVAGDDPRAIDWNVTARHGRPFVKRYVDERERTVAFLLDLSASMSTSFGGFTPRQAAARVVAPLALAACADHDQVALFAGGARVEHVVAPLAGAHAALRLVRDVLALPPARGRADLVPLLDLATRALPGGSIVVLLSDFHADGWRAAALRCAARHDLVGVGLAADALPPPTAGLVRLRDPESGGEQLFDARDPRVRVAVAARIAEVRERTRRDLRRAGAEFLELPLATRADPAALQRSLARFFFGRAARRARA
ncbi:MAG: DUF58 domain-containing protein [Planctomycetes bacterium]|nr:DUF58 domain-containing protein [Planctomycetota bacterium]